MKKLLEYAQKPLYQSRLTFIKACTGLYSDKRLLEALTALAKDKVALVRIELAVSVAENYTQCEEIDAIVAVLRKDSSPLVMNEINTRLPSQ